MYLTALPINNHYFPTQTQQLGLITDTDRVLHAVGIAVLHIIQINVSIQKLMKANVGVPRSPKSDRPGAPCCGDYADGN
jgi:hypothetical protein